MPDYMTSGGNVGSVLQDILARKRAESRQAFLDDLTKRSTESEIAGREAAVRYQDILGKATHEGMMGGRLGRVAPGTSIEGIDPELVKYGRGLGQIGPGPTPSVTTLESFPSGDPSMTDVQGDINTSIGESLGEVFTGNYEQQKAREKEAGIGAVIADQSTPEALRRSLLMFQLGATPHVDPAAVNPGQIVTIGPTGKVNTTDREYGGDISGMLNFDPARTAEAQARAARSNPDLKVEPGIDPQTQLPQNYIWDRNNPAFPPIPTFMGPQATPTAINPNLADQYQAAQNAANNDTWTDNQQADELTATVFFNSLIAQAAPRVRDVVTQIRSNPQLRQLASNMPAAQAAQLIAQNAGLTPAEAQQLAIYIPFAVGK